MVLSGSPSAFGGSRCPNRFASTPHSSTVRDRVHLTVVETSGRANTGPSGRILALRSASRFQKHSSASPLPWPVRGAAVGTLEARRLRRTVVARRHLDARGPPLAAAAQRG